MITYTLEHNGEHHTFGLFDDVEDYCEEHNLFMDEEYSSDRLDIEGDDDILGTFGIIDLDTARLFDDDVLDLPEGDRAVIFHLMENHHQDFEAANMNRVGKEVIEGDIDDNWEWYARDVLGIECDKQYIDTDAVKGEMSHYYTEFEYNGNYYLYDDAQ